jgi:hypothetical protein
MNPALVDLPGKHRIEPVPTEPHRFVADIGAAPVEKVFDLTERQRIVDLDHHRQADDLRGTVEIMERISAPTKL